MATAAVSAETAAHAAPTDLDLVFCMDCTGSMGSYIAAAQRTILDIIEKLVAFEKTDVRFGLVAYRDHPPQDSSFITHVFPFTNSRKEITDNVNWMKASGGGDGPEAVAAGLKAAYDMPWRPTATKIVILIADAPPHGLGESGDGFPEGSPDGVDPIAVARDMSQHGISCYTVGCEPALGSYKHARAFMVSLAELTQGQAVALGSASGLADVILGGAQEALGLEKLQVKAAEVAAKAEADLRTEAAMRSRGAPVAAPSDKEIASRMTDVHSACCWRVAL